MQHQKSVKIAKKSEKRIIDFQKSSNIFSITAYKKKSRRTHNYRKKSYIALMKLIKRHQKIRYLISTSKFKEHTRTHLKFFIEKTWCPGRRKKMTTSCWFQSMQIWLRRNEAQMNRRCPTPVHSWSIHFWNKTANVSVKVQYKKNTMSEPNQHMENTHAN